MGFECGLKVVPRINNIDIEKYLYTKAHLDFDNNYWIKNNYDSFKEYFESAYSLWGDTVECKYPEIDFRMDDYREIKEDTIDWWCSIGRTLDDEFIQGKLEQIKPFEYYELSKNQVEEILKAVNESLKEEKLIPTTVSYAVFDGGGEEKTLKACDGLLVEDDYGNQHLLDFRFDNIWVPKKYFDIDYHYTKESFRDALEKLLEYDFNRNIILYYRSY